VLLLVDALSLGLSEPTQQHEHELLAILVEDVDYGIGEGLPSNLRIFVFFFFFKSNKTQVK